MLKDVMSYYDWKLQVRENDVYINRRGDKRFANWEVVEEMVFPTFQDAWIAFWDRVNHIDPTRPRKKEDLYVDEVRISIVWEENIAELEKEIRIFPKRKR